jgi:hypothetical protein
MVVAVKGDELRVDAITDEFVTVAKTSDLIAKLDAVVQWNTQGCQVVEEDANRKKVNETTVAAAANGTSTGTSRNKLDGPATKKRKFQSRKNTKK